METMFLSSADASECVIHWQLDASESCDPAKVATVRTAFNFENEA